MESKNSERMGQTANKINGLSQIVEGAIINARIIFGLGFTTILNA
jgi:hypothetical protein